MADPRSYVTRYSCVTRIGNWFEDLNVEETRRAVYKKYFDDGKLSIQKLEKLLNKLLLPVELTLPALGLCYGAVLQLHAPHVKSKNKDGIFLSVTFKHQDNAEDISEGYIFVGSASSRPCVRNTFVLEPDSKDKQGHVIKYGDCLYVRLAASQRDLYLSCEVKKFHSDVGGSDFVRPVLTRKNNYCRFKVQLKDANKRKLAKGSTVSSADEVVLEHESDGQFLAAKVQHLVQTCFGQECEITCHSMKDLLRRETCFNVWKFVLGH